MSEPAMTSAQVRGKLVEALTLDLIGPIADPGRADERLDQPPSRWYLTGFLVPRVRPSKDRPHEDDEPDDLFASDDDPLDDPTAETVPLDDSDKAAPAQPTRRQILPSSMGLSVLVPRAAKSPEVTVRWGDYHPELAAEESDPTPAGEPFALDPPAAGGSPPKPEKSRKVVSWSREQRQEVLTLDLQGEFPRPRAQGIRRSDGLQLVWLNRAAPDEALDERLVHGGANTVNIYLVNTREPETGAAKDRRMAFQAELIVHCAEGFVPRPNLRGLNSNDDDERVADLQFRDACEFAVGHNVSAVARGDEHCRCSEVRTAWVPSAEVERVEPAEIVGVELGMEALAALPDSGAAHVALIGLADRYREWIEAQRQVISSLHYAQRVETCEQLLLTAGVAADRIAKGIGLLSQPKVFRAFTLANAAMARQARRRESQRLGIKPEDVTPPRWRPFQLAFLLLNLEGIVEPDSADRRTVELLFFPTGGGKTEAYLGLAAFTLIYRRLRTGVAGAIPMYAGVTVLMRYTLRLLTLDQLARAAALICALELMRAENPKELGTWPFEIGLWVGSGATPNVMGKPGQEYGMVFRVLQFKQGLTSRPPVPLQQCPWCGTPFRPDSFHLHPSQDNAEELRITCLGDDCDFSGDRTLPVQMVDEPIYRRLPGFLIATVDKFAAMPWKGEVAKLFGRVNSFKRGAGFLNDCDDEEGVELDGCLPPPELIIQDELHLISGPLGTIAGLYETAIDRLCRDPAGRGAKIVSSTATVRRATDQIGGLFGRSSVQIFPTPGPDRRNSFFSMTVPASGDSPARLYLGVAAQGRSPKRVLVKTYLALMSAAYKLYQSCGGEQNPENPADPYMTMLGYFNSLRELGGTRRLVEDELTSRLGQYGKRRRPGESEADSPFVDRAIGKEVRELTSRYTTDKVAEAKDALNRPFGASGGVDVALATNMISVGLDIPRLGLMTVFAQPKMISEYIQSTSRVGRQRDKPGLIVTIFNINRPRDRSHYERFRFTHETFYRSVEATSVTPFSPRALDRALFAVTVALTRLGHDYMVRNYDAQAILEHSQHLDDVAETIAERAGRHQRDGLAGAHPEPTTIRAKVRALLDEWFKYAEDLHQDQAALTYEPVKTPRTKKLLHEMLDPGLAELPTARQQFKAPRSMRDVEPNTALLPRRYGQEQGTVKIKNVKTTVSSLRQSQLVTTYGPGAMIDLPWFAAVVAGLDFWPKGTRIVEPRLEAKAKAALGVDSIELATPQALDKLPDAQTTRGVVVWRFPGWSLTQATKTEKGLDGQTFQTRLLVRPSWIDSDTGLYNGRDFQNPAKERSHEVVPIRFIRACKNGHMGDIDWSYFVHQDGRVCTQDLWLDDMGTTGELTELRVRCGCGAKRFVSEAAGTQNPALGMCDGSQRWLGSAIPREPCRETNRLLIRTASNAYFPQKVSVISLPDRGQAVHAAVSRLWGTLQAIDHEAHLPMFRRIESIGPALAEFDDAEIMRAIVARRSGQDGLPARKIKEAEFELLTCGQSVIGKNEFDSVFHAEEYPRERWEDEVTAALDRVLIVHRLREVTALVGYTRFDYISPDIDGEFDLGLTSAKLGVNTAWVPAIENKGEGLFLQFNKERVDRWKERSAVRALEASHQQGLLHWCQERDVGRDDKFCQAPYVMLHSLSHLLINAISLECGYPAASLKERIYANPDQGYGILLYTASSDSHGTLGGLAEAARSIGHYLRSALEMGRLCSNDPVCAQHDPGDQHERRYLQGAACHGCLLISETSCELFNDFLDRGLVVSTVECKGAEFFTLPL